MSAGTLSADQDRYVNRLVAGTGLDRTVAVAWVGAESGWDATKAAHNYLNIGPGRTYASADQGAIAAAALVNSSAHYAGIRAAISHRAVPAAQIQAIGASPWGTSGTSLANVYGQLTGSTGVPLVTNVGIHLPGTPITIPTSPGEVIDAVQRGAEAAGGIFSPLNPANALDAIGDTLSKTVKLGIELFAQQFLGLLFATAALALIALGLNRLTGVPPSERFGQMAGMAGQAAAVAAVV